MVSFVRKTVKQKNKKKVKIYCLPIRKMVVIIFRKYLPIYDIGKQIIKKSGNEFYRFTGKVFIKGTKYKITTSRYKGKKNKF